MASEEFILSSFWGAMILCALMTQFIPLLNSIAIHGKCRTSSPSRSGFNLIHEWCQVPKSLFKLMYLLGFWLAIVSLLYAVISDSPLRIQGCLLLWMIHNFRRYYESCFMTIYGPSSMHVGGFVAGILHYTMVPLTLLSSRPQLKNALMLDLIGFSTFWFAMWSQYHSHYLLFCLKSQKAKFESNSRYQLPTQSLFRFVSCPHYTAEIIIYFSLLLLVQFDYSTTMLFFWVSINLAIVANMQFLWYHEQYQSSIPKGWGRLFPGIW